MINREREVRVDSRFNSSSGKSLVKNKVALEKDSEVVEEHIEQVLFVFPVDTLRLKAGMEQLPDDSVIDPADRCIQLYRRLHPRTGAL